MLHHREEYCSKIWLYGLNYVGKLKGRAGLFESKRGSVHRIKYNYKNSYESYAHVFHFIISGPHLQSVWYSYGALSFVWITCLLRTKENRSSPETQRRSAGGGSCTWLWSLRAYGKWLMMTVQVITHIHLSIPEHNVTEFYIEPLPTSSFDSSGIYTNYLQPGWLDEGQQAWSNPLKLCDRLERWNRGTVSKVKPRERHRGSNSTEHATQVPIKTQTLQKEPRHRTI